MLSEPALSPDATQPNPALRPARPLRGWLLLSVALSLPVTLLLLLTLTLPAAPSRPPVAVALVVAGQPRQVLSQAATVGDLLAEQGVLLAAGDTVSYPPQTALAAGLSIVVERARLVTVRDGDRTQTLATTATSPYDILRQAGLTVQPPDRIWIDGTLTGAEQLLLWAVPPLEIVVRRAVTVTIRDGATTQEHHSAADTVGEALFEAGITLYAADHLSQPGGTPLTGPTTITITRAHPFMIEVDGGTLAGRSRAATVGAALADSGIVLTGLDYVLPGEQTPLTPGLTLRVIRVTEAIVSEEEAIPYATVYQADPARELDTRTTVQAGQPGVRRYDSRVRYEDGQEIGREPAGDTVVRPPVDEIIAYGTQIVLRTVDTPAGPREYWRRLRVYATSYHPRALGGDDSTALGLKLEKGMVAADPRLIPWRTAVYVPDYGLGIIGDTGGARRSRYWIDLGYSDADYTSWHRYTEIYLLTPVPADIPYLLPEWSPP